jgi:hypothetical protein
MTYLQSVRMSRARSNPAAGFTEKTVEGIAGPGDSGTSVEQARAADRVASGTHPELVPAFHLPSLIERK